MTARAPILARLALVALVAGCRRDDNSFFAPVGPQADRIYTVFTVMVTVCAAVWLIVTVIWVIGIWRMRREPAVGDAVSRPVAPPDPAGERRLLHVTSAAVGTTVVILFVFLFVEYTTSRSMVTSLDRKPVDIEIVGHQWWWEVRYQDSIPSNVFTTANEIHVPVGRPVRLILSASDVIHSFWAPNVNGKMDLIPGHTNATWFQIDEPGTYRGKCAEFCGLQHAKMDFVIVAEAPERYAAWLQGQRAPSAAPTDSLRLRGQEVFLAGTCITCHTIRGTPAGGKVGPDLTHLASRSTIGAGALPNRRGYLGGWIVDPQSIKPGAKMPANRIPAEDLQALIAYLENLR